MSLEPPVGAITSIALDHQQHLGDTLDGDCVREGRHHQAGHDGRVRARCRTPRLDVVRGVAAERGARLVEAAHAMRACESAMETDAPA